MEHGEEMGCINMSAFTTLVQELELDDDELTGLYEQIEERGIELTDDCSLPEVDEATYVNSEVAAMTTDSLQLFLNEAGRYPLLTAAEEVELAKADRARRQAGEGPDGQLEPPSRRLDREEVPGPRPAADRPDPGRDHRA